MFLQNVDIYVKNRSWQSDISSAPLAKLLHVVLINLAVSDSLGLLKDWSEAGGFSLLISFSTS